MIGTSTDKDWYVFSTTTSQPNFKITLTNLPADYDMKLYNSSGRQIAVSQNSGTTDESITRNTTSAGTWYLQIYGYSGAYNASSCYQFKVITSGTSLLTGATEGIVAGNKPGGDLFGNELAVYPNPVRGSMNVYVNAANSSRSQLKMIDIAGRMVMNQTLQLQKGMNTIAVDVARLAPGTYLIKMDGLNTVKVQVAQ
jgi:hypothetical protein